MKLYGSLASPYVARVVLFSRLKGFDLEPQMPEGGIKSAAYLAINPMGKMPLLESDGLAIPESEVICEYLEDLRPGQGGLAGSPAARARARLISRIQDLYVGPNATTLIRNLNPAKRDAAAVAAATSGIETGFGYLEHFVTADPFAAGPTPGLADCALLPAFVVLRKAVCPAFGVADPTSGTGALGRWWKTVSGDAVTAAFAAQYAAAVDAFLKMMAGK
jgi:glutathione S-transferase